MFLTILLSLSSAAPSSSPTNNSQANNFFDTKNPLFLTMVGILSLIVAFFAVREAYLKYKTAKLQHKGITQDEKGGSAMAANSSASDGSISNNATTGPTITVGPFTTYNSPLPQAEQQSNVETKAIKNNDANPANGSGYGPVKLRSKYRSLYAEDEELMSEEIMIISQDNGVVEGVIKLDGEEKYTYKGTFQNQILTGEYYSKDPHDSERGSINLKLVTGTLLSGFCSFSKYASDPARDPIRVSPYVWVSTEDCDIDLLNGTFQFCADCDLNSNESANKAFCCASKLVDMPIMLEREVKHMQDSYFRTYKRNLRQKEFSEPVRVLHTQDELAASGNNQVHLDDSLTSIRRVYRQQEKPKKGRVSKQRDESDLTDCPCYFYDTEKMVCSIYSERPVDCRLFPYDIVLYNNDYWVVYYDELCKRPLPDIDDMKMYAHVLRPYFFIYWPYLHITTSKNTAPRLSDQSYKRLFRLKDLVF